MLNAQKTVGKKLNKYRVMQGTTEFREIIWNYLLERAESDEQIAQNLYKENKSIDECIQYIFQEVKKSGYNGFSDMEIYSMAIHYYDEDSIGSIKPIEGVRVVVNEPIKNVDRADKKVSSNSKKKKYEVEQLLFGDEDESQD